MPRGRLKSQDTVPDVFAKLSEGYPGALTVCMGIFTQGATIDPDNFMAGLGPLLALDTLGIYGASIWTLYKYICGEDITKTLAVLRAWQLGFVSDAEIRLAIEACHAGGCPTDLNPETLLAQVQERLPMFGQGAREP